MNSKWVWGIGGLVLGVFLAPKIRALVPIPQLRNG